jgi:hypothetical protein
MKKTILTMSVCLLLFIGAIAFSFAQFDIPTPDTPSSNQPSSTDKAQPAEKKEEFKGFSGKYTTYTSKDGQYKINIPEEFKMTAEGFTTDWTGPLVDEMAASISVNYVDMPGVSSDILYNVNLKSYKEKTKEYTDIQPVTVKWGKKTAKAFRVKETNFLGGNSANVKKPGDIHRWHLLVFGNNKSYTLGFSGNYSSFTGNKLQKMFEEVIKSFELI